MKIRTDFVTNSSSYNTAVVIIDNPILLEIMQKYKDMGLFGEKEPFFGIGTYDSYAHEYYGDHGSNHIKTPAFYYYEDDSDEYSSDDLTFGAPGSLEGVLMYIIEIMDEGKENLDEAILAELKKELEQRIDEINHAYLEVDWSNEQSCDDGESKYRFQYDPVNGERYEERTAEEFHFYDIVGEGDPEVEEALRDNLGYGKIGSEKDDFWEYAKRVGYIGNFNDFPMDEYNKYKKTGEITLCESWIEYFGNE